MERGTRILGRFVIEERLGESGRGGTWLAREIASGQARVVKVLPSVSDPREVAALRAKLESARRAHAPALVKALEVGLSTDLEAACVVSELIDGQGIEAPVEAHEAASLARQIAAALRALHGAGHAHGALHASNVILDRAGRVRLRDFALTAGSPEEDVRALGGLVLSWLAPDDESAAAAQLRAVATLCERALPAGDIERALEPLARNAPPSRSYRPQPRQSDVHERPGVSEPATLVIRCRLPAALRFRTASEQAWLAEALGERARITLVDDEIVGMLETDVRRAEDLARRVRVALRARSPDAQVDSVIRAQAPLRTTAG